MTDAVTSHESWQSISSAGTPCWNCKQGQYIVYASDATKTSRCGQCGELEQDDPAKSKPAPVRRSTAKSKEKA